MASFSHEGFVRLFYNRPTLAVELLRDVIGVAVPAHAHVRIDSADLTDIEPAHRYADLVLLLEDDQPVFGIVVEVQLDIDAGKLFSWPAYITNLRSRLRCDVELLVITPHLHVARWASRPIPVGQGTIRPLVLGPDGVPRVTSDAVARADPELAVLSAMAHGHGAIEEAVPIALAALAGAVTARDGRGVLYSDLVLAALGDAARVALEDLMRAEKYEYQSDFARQHQAIGKAEGKAEGTVEAVLTVLDARGLQLTEVQRAHIISSKDAAELDRWLRKAVTISSVSELFV